jgi:hypothetical protein
MSTEDVEVEQAKELEPPAESPETAYELEKQEEAKLQTKYPQAGKPMAGHSAFLAKRLTKGQKYFDSGDYQVAIQTAKGKPRTMPPILSVAPEIPTPDSVSCRKTSLVQQPSKLANSS